MKRAMKWSIAECMLHLNEHFFLPKRVASMKKHISNLRKSTDNSGQQEKPTSCVDLEDQLLQGSVERGVHIQIIFGEQW